jgi:adenine phosphoribosyltransferase
MNLERFIRDVPDFPKPGIMFKDITPLLRDAQAMKETIRLLSEPYKGKVDLVAGIESRGFVFGSLVADRLGVGFVPIRKPGKLPHKTICQSYELEYGTNTVEIHCDAVSQGQRVLLVDDLLATGGTMSAARKLVESLGGTVVAAAFVVELAFLKGRSLLNSLPVLSLIKVS